MTGVLSSIAGHLQELSVSTGSQDAATELPAMVAVNHEDSPLEIEHRQLLATEAELEATAVESDDLEHVVGQLRVRVGQLEARESKVKELRQECRSLRTRLAELIASTMDQKTLETERAELARELEVQEQHFLAKLSKQAQLGPKSEHAKLAHQLDSGNDVSPPSEVTENCGACIEPSMQV